MAITKRTVLDQVEVLRGGGMQVRLAKVIEEDGVELTEPQYHRTAIEPATDPVHQMRAVNVHLQALGHAAVSNEDVARIAALKAAVSNLDQSGVYKATMTALTRQGSA